MEYIIKLDNQIDNILDNDIVYSLVIILLIIIVAFPNITKESALFLTKNIPSIFNLTRMFTIMLHIVFILYILNKDIRIGVILMIIYLICLESKQRDDINKQLLNLLVKDISIEQRLDIVEKKQQV